MDALGLALGAAVLLGAAAVFQHRAALTAPHKQGAPALLGHLAAHPVWLTGVLAMLGGYALQAAALGEGRITVVEPVLVCSLVVGLPLSTLWLRQRLRRTDWLAGFCVAVGVVAFLLAARPEGGTENTATEHWLVVLPATAFAIVALLVVARWGGSWWRPLGFASAGGLGLGVADAITKPVVTELAARPLVLFTSWQLYVLVGVGALAFLLVQAAYHAGHIGRSLPAVTLLEPLTASLLGVTLFEEHLRSAPPYLAAESLAVLVAAIGVIALARSPLVQGESPATI